MSPTWRGTVDLTFPHKDESHRVTADALDAGGAVRIAIGKVLAGRPRQRDQVTEVTVTMTKEDA